MIVNSVVQLKVVGSIPSWVKLKTVELVPLPESGGQRRYCTRGSELSHSVALHG